MDQIDESKLKPCPFCGAGETSVEYKTTAPRMNSPNLLISVVLRHWCDKRDGVVHNYREIRGRDCEGIAAAWDTRA